MAANHGAGTLKSTSINGVKLYSLTGNRYVAPWVLAKKKRSLRKDKGAYPIPPRRVSSPLLTGLVREIFVILVDSSRLLFSLFGCRVSAEVGFDP
jgi:hypothetical protein